jgi:polyisoprenoid-binding protein YceI
MKRQKFTAIAIILVIASSFTLLQMGNWTITSNYSIKFSGTKVEGVFEKIKGDISFDENNLSKSKFDLNIEVESIATGNWLKNSHAKGSKWFDAEKYPNINFLSNKFSKTANGYLVNGILTMHGVQKEINIPFTFSNSIFQGNFSVNRLDYNIGTMEGMSKKVSNEIKLNVTLHVTKK